MRVKIFRPSFFIWVVIPVAAYLTYLFLGLPHFIWSYSWRDDGQGHDPFASRWYTRCSFYGPYGGFTTYPDNGKCSWVLFQKKTGGV